MNIRIGCVTVILFTLYFFFPTTIYSESKTPRIAPKTPISTPSGSLTSGTPATSRVGTSFDGWGTVVDVVQYSDQPYLCEFYVMQNNGKLVRALVGPLTDTTNYSYPLYHSISSLICDTAAHAMITGRLIRVGGTIRSLTSSRYEHGFMTVSFLEYHNEGITGSYGSREVVEFMACDGLVCNGLGKVGKVTIYADHRYNMCSAYLLQFEGSIEREVQLVVKQNYHTVAEDKKESMINDRIRLCETLVEGVDAHDTLVWFKGYIEAPKMLVVGDVGYDMWLKGSFSPRGYENMEF